MSEFDRAYNLLRGYIGREWDRLADIDRSEAAQELDDSVPVHPKYTQPDGATVYEKPAPAMDAELARRILGVEPSASYEEIERAYVRLQKRSDPSRFDPASVEFRWAVDINRRIHKAYSLLTEEMSVTEKRFGSLEI